MIAASQCIGADCWAGGLQVFGGRMAKHAGKDLCPHILAPIDESWGGGELAGIMCVGRGTSHRREKRI